MDDLVQFLHARLDEDTTAAQTAASKAGGGTWAAGTEHGKPWVSGLPAPGGYVVPLLIEFGYGNPDDYERAVHIARHDPARALREVEAKRRLLNDHPIQRETYPRPASGDKEVGGPHFPFGCATCHAEPDTGEVHGFGYCLTWKALTLPYADHPDYRDTWRP
ncbi:DUF6221 family protein [Streptomyces californicus]|uniref:DUF6221 family protein n=1 Tax=Streptomyces californicus TaxID=67351 RepID=UPI0037FF39CD